MSVVLRENVSDVLLFSQTDLYSKGLSLRSHCAFALMPRSPSWNLTRAREICWRAPAHFSLRLHNRTKPKLRLRACDGSVILTARDTSETAQGLAVSIALSSPTLSPLVEQRRLLASVRSQLRHTGDRGVSPRIWGFGNRHAKE